MHHDSGLGDLGSHPYNLAKNSKRNDKSEPASLTDDFSMWGGDVFLCGMKLHEDTGKRVHGIAPVWCYYEAYVAPESSPSGW